MAGFENAKDTLAIPWVVGSALPPVRAQIPSPNLDFHHEVAILNQVLQEQRRDAPPNAKDVPAPTRALADAWAVIADILGFYQARIVNESYIGTALEGGSLRQLAGMVAYASDDGLAATCHVYYQIDESVEGDVRIPAGSRIRAVPRPGEPSLTFETRKDLVARSSFNIIRPATTCPAVVNLATEKIYLRGTNSGLKPNDLVRVARKGGKDAVVREIYFLVRAIEFDRPSDQTIVSVALRYPPTKDIPGGTRETASAAGAAPPSKSAFVDPAYYDAASRGEAWIEKNIVSILGEPPDEATDVELTGYRRRAQVFGHNAPRRRKGWRQVGDAREWPLDEGDKKPDVIDLEGHLPGLQVNSRLCLEIPDRSAIGGDLEFYTVTSVQLTARTAYGMTGDVTRVTLDRDWKVPGGLWDGTYQEAFEEVVQRVTIHVDDVTLRLGMMPVTADATSDSPQTLELDRVYMGLEPGRQIVLDGEPPQSATREKMREPELLTIREVKHPLSREQQEASGQKDAAVLGRPLRTIVTFETPPQFRYDWTSVKIFGNVVEASHGETNEEVLGSGDASREFQSFALTRRPLSLLPDRAFPGVRGQLSVQVSGETWGQVATLADAGKGRRVFATWNDDTTRITFGNGVFGARLPSGRENVIAKYQVGLGRAGNVDQGRLKLAVNHPLGVREVSNVRASGGADPEPSSRMRTNAPLSTIPLEHVVCADDFDNFARTQPGVSKARTFIKSTSVGDFVVVSIVGDPAESLTPRDSLCEMVRSAMIERGDGSPRILVVPGKVFALRVSAQLQVAADKAWDDVSRAVRAALFAQFGFEVRELGQAANASEVLAVIQSVEGVDFAVLKGLERYDPESSKMAQFNGSVEATKGGFDNVGNAVPAELLHVAPYMPSSVVLEPWEKP